MTRRVEIDSLIKPLIFVHDGVHAFFTTNSLKNDLTGGIAKLTSIPEKNIYLPIQRHTNKIHALESDFKPVVADAVITRRKAVLIGVQVADCVPILLYDSRKSAIGAVHAGWRGTAKEILKNAINTMQERFNSAVKDILIALGPGIRQCCYSVGEEVKNAIYKATGEGNYYHQQDGKHFIDISYANKIQALSVGVPEENIWQSDECTFCNPQKFYSYRYTKDSAGRQGGFIGMW